MQDNNNNYNLNNIDFLFKIEIKFVRIKSNV